MADRLSPFVYWGQNCEKIFLKVDLKEVTNQDIEITEDFVRLHTEALGVQGRKQYGFKIEFYLPVEPNESRYRITDRYIEFQLQKVGIDETWPRLTYGQKKPAWLKIDFDHFAFDDSEEEMMNNEINEKQEERQWMEHFEKELQQGQEKAIGDVKTLYLFIYNMFMWIGYSYVLVAMAIQYYKYGEESKKKAFDAVAPQLMMCQIAAVMEIIHPVVGLVKTGFFTPLVQVFGRNFILFGILAPESHLQDREVVWWLFMTWCAVELIRYPYYLLNTVKMEWGFITWLRYTIWIPLYPLGFLLEGLVMLIALPRYEESGRWTVELPNSLNFAFHFPTFLRVYMLAFLPGMYILMRRMYTQRKQKLGPKTRKQSTKKKL